MNTVSILKNYPTLSWKRVCEMPIIDSTKAINGLYILMATVNDAKKDTLAEKPTSTFITDAMFPNPKRTIIV